MVRCKHHPAGKGFTLVETMIAVGVLAVVSVGTMSTVIFMREMAEYDKQRISAYAVARTYLEEETRRAAFPTMQAVEDQVLDDFNTPNQTDNLMATVSLHYYEVDADGTRGDELFAMPETPQLVEAEVTVTWNRTGRMSERQASVSLSTFKFPDL